jgi:hypothetical protein
MDRKNQVHVGYKHHSKLLEQTAQLLRQKETLDQTGWSPIRARLAGSPPPATPPEV